MYNKQREKVGLIRNLTYQPAFDITINGVHICKVVLDSWYFEGEARKIEDAKGMLDEMSDLKRKLVEACYPGTKIILVYKNKIAAE